jgi:hypothetical protein
MKMFGKNEDRVIDNLLRANTRGRRGAATACREFDPDLANAYIERSLTASERAGYERHLSDCHACRSSMVVLARIAAAEAAPSALAQPVREAGRFETLKSLFTVSALPRVAAAALAVIVLAISIPLLISRKDSTSPTVVTSSDVAVDQLGASAGKSTEPPSTPAPGNRDLNPLQGTISPPDAMPRARAEQDKPDVAQSEIAPSRPSLAEPDTAAATGARAARTEPPQTEKLETSRAAESSYQERKAESDAQLIAKDQQPAPPPPAPEAPKPLGQINPDEARRLPQRDKDAASVTIQRGKPDGAPGAEKERTIRPDDAVAPPSRNEAAGSGPQRGLAASSPRATRDREDASSSASARSSTMRKIGSKKFWLSKDTWTDKDYNANKEMPVVTVERDSDIYKELLTKRSGLKLYLMSFGEGERAIFVYKGTVYKLIPQNSR